MSALDRLAEIEQRSNASTIGKSAWRNLDAALIDIRKTVAALRAVLDLHRPEHMEVTADGRVSTVTACAHCGHWGDDYPCETTEVITAALGGGE